MAVAKKKQTRVSEVAFLRKEIARLDKIIKTGGSPAKRSPTKTGIQKRTTAIVRGTNPAAAKPARKTTPRKKVMFEVSWTHGGVKSVAWTENLGSAKRIAQAAADMFNTSVSIAKK